MKKIVLILLLVFSISLAGCNKEETYTIYDAASELEVSSELSNTVLLSKFHGFDLTWEANPSSYINGYELVPSFKDTTIVLTAVISDGNNSTSKQFNVTVLGNPYLTVESYMSSLLYMLDIPLVLKDDIELPKAVGEYPIKWVSSDSSILSSLGILLNINLHEETEIILTARINDDTYDHTASRTFHLTIEPVPLSDSDYLMNMVNSFPFVVNNVTSNLYLPTAYEDVLIEWESSDENYISSNGIVTRPDASSMDKRITLTAYFSYNEITISKSFVVYVIAMEPSYLEYYTGIEGLTSEALKSFLHDLIDDHTTYSYSSLWTALSETDEDPNNPNNVILFYTGKSVLKTSNGCCNDDWNREHVWAKSHGSFGTDIGPGTDMHHIRPTDASVNGERGNLDFDDGGYFVEDGSQLTENKKDGDSFEPRDEVKGDVARMIFYMAVRYEGDDGWADLEINNLVNNSGPFMGKLDTLIEWHLSDPPDQFEINRNEVIYSYQGNRNPFIDYPELVGLIWGN